MKEVHGDIWATPCDAICITTNGSVTKRGRAVMGRGIALQAVKRFPRLDLPTRLAQGLATSGNRVGIISTPSMRPELVVFPVKHQWYEDADIDLVIRSAEELVMVANEVRRWTRVILPRPGCGNGRLDWVINVRPVLALILDERFTVVDRAK